MMNIVTRTNKEAEAQSAKVIRSLSLYKQIVREAYERGIYVRVIDVRPNRDDRSKSVFVFENTPEFQSLLSSIIDERRAARENAEAAAANEVADLKNELEELKKLVANINKPKEE